MYVSGSAADTVAIATVNGVHVEASRLSGEGDVSLWYLKSKCFGGKSAVNQDACLPNLLTCKCLLLLLFDYLLYCTHNVALRG